MKLSEILENKGNEIHSASPQDTLGDVVNKLVKNNCGALIVRDGEKMVGIVSERDVLRACAELARPLDAIVSDRMTTDLVTGTLGDDVGSVMGLLTHHRIRHLPILKDGELVGVISIGDVVKAQYEDLSAENQLLKKYIQG